MSDSSAPVCLRAVGPEDAEFLVVLMAASKPEFAGLPAEQAPRLVRMQVAAQHRDYERAYPDSEHQIVICNGQAVGRIWVARSKEEIRVVDISLAPPWRRKGIGTRLYRQLMSEAQPSGRPVRCSVFRFNEASLEFHRRLGFRSFAENEVMVELEWWPEGSS